MYIIGVTGSIGSGKSTVAHILGDMSDTPVVDADSIARELVEPGREALVSIVEVFGDKMILKNGTLNRKKLGDLIFNDTDSKDALNKIMFPLIRKRAIEHFNGHAVVGREYLIYDAPLLFQSGSQDIVDYICLVYVPRDVQIERIMDRNNLTSAEATARVNAQPSSEELLDMPIDYVVNNTTDYIGLNGIVTNMWKNIQSRKGR